MWGGAQIGVMCSDGLRKVGLYEKYLLSKNPSSKVLYPTEELQVCVTKGICNSKNTKRFLPISDEENPVNCFSKVCDWFIHQGCDTIIAGCTDIRNVFYGEYVGSGVCQVSTTIYNAALLLNLQIVERLNHGAMVPYVDYGMDATVYSNTTDFRFKNNSNYPIYIEASANDGKLIVNFWSNENIIEKGYRYQPRSVKIGNLAYKTYLDTYYNDELIKTTYLNSSYYYKGK